jgi:hypothetical protein
MNVRADGRRRMAGAATRAMRMHRGKLCSAKKAKDVFRSQVMRRSAQGDIVVQAAEHRFATQCGHRESDGRWTVTRVR